nr:hypothetical protein [uncultured Desulfobulbus sp.]
MAWLSSRAMPVWSQDKTSLTVGRSVQLEVVASAASSSNEEPGFPAGCGAAPPGMEVVVMWD